MVERSYFWDGTSTGDASLAPATIDTYNALIWKMLLASADNQGYIDGYEDKLLVSGASIAVKIGKGAALVNGTFYINDAVKSVSIPTPTSNPRIDRIVLQKIWVGRTIRIARVAGTEGASPSAPALTQTANIKWEIPLAQAQITTAGAITVTDGREVCNMRTSLKGSLEEIETFAATGIENQIDFQNIPQKYKSLVLMGNATATGVSGICWIYLNNDTLGTNYYRQILISQNATPLANAAKTVAERWVVNPRTGAVANVSSYMEMEILNYADDDKFKVFRQKEQFIDTNTPADIWDFSNAMQQWNNTDPVTSVTIQLDAPAGLFKVGTKVTLYGRR